MAGYSRNKSGPYMPERIRTHEHRPRLARLISRENIAACMCKGACQVDVGWRQRIFNGCQEKLMAYIRLHGVFEKSDTPSNRLELAAQPIAPIGEILIMS